MKSLPWCGLLLCFLAGGAFAQETETVTVYGGTLAGVWKVNSPGWLQIDLLGDIKWGPLQQVFCRIEQGGDGYTTYCFQQRSSGGALEVDGAHFHLDWGTMLARMVFDGEVQSATHFTGHFAAKLMGIPVHDTDVAEGDKQDIRPEASDAGGSGALLRAILEGAALPHDTALDPDITAARTIKLGAIQAVAYLGPQSSASGPKRPAEPNYLSVYAVEFEKGERLCWLRRKDDGSLQIFQCA